MDWNVLANFGFAGAMLGVLGLIAKVWIASNERIQVRQNAVEDKKADAMASALMSLSGKIDQHHSLDIQSHTALATGIAELKGKLDEAIGWQERTPVEHKTPKPGVYGLRRPGTRNDE